MTTETPVLNTIYNGDALEVMSKWESGIFDCAIVDPPYNFSANRKGITWKFSSHVAVTEEWDKLPPDENEEFTRKWMQQVSRVTKLNGNILIFGNFNSIYTIGHIAQKMDLRVINSLIWAKTNAQPCISCRMFTESTEQVIWLCNNSNKKAKNWTFNYKDMKAMNNNKQMRNYWLLPLTPPREKKFGQHPTQKSLTVIERLVKACTNPGDKILDCFLGSGTTALSAETHGRQWVGIERDAGYCTIAQSRIDNHRAEKATKQQSAVRGKTAYAIAIDEIGWVDPQIVRAAIKIEDGTVYSVEPPGRHPEVIALMCGLGIYAANEEKSIQGFLLSDGNFIERDPAGVIALRNGQCKALEHPPSLYSEDLW